MQSSQPIEVSSIVFVEPEPRADKAESSDSSTGKNVEQHGTSGPPRRVDVQVLRALAVSAVVFYHLGFNWMRGGFVGVDVFFVISGFLVFGSVARGLEGKKYSLVEFYARRAKRINPPSALMLLVLLCVLWNSGYCQTQVGCETQFRDIQWAALQGANINQMLKRTGGYFEDREPSIVLHFWSLAVEEQLYVAVPFVLGLLRFGCRTAPRYSRVVGPFLVVTTALSFATMFAQPDKWRFFFLASRYWEFGLGALVAVYDVSKIPVPPRLQHWEYKMAALAVLDSYPNALTLPVCVATAVVIGCKIEYRAPVLKQIGDLSYSMYLYHWPIILLCNYYMTISSTEVVFGFTGDSHMMQFWKPLYNYGEQLGVSTYCVYDQSTVLTSPDIGWMRSLLAEHPELRDRVEMVSFNDLVCWDGKCHSHVNDVPVYVDCSHYTTMYVDYALNLIMARLRSSKCIKRAAGVIDSATEGGWKAGWLLSVSNPAVTLCLGNSTAPCGLLQITGGRVFFAGSTTLLGRALNTSALVDLEATFTTVRINVSSAALLMTSAIDRPFGGAIQSLVSITVLLPGPPAAGPVALSGMALYGTRYCDSDSTCCGFEHCNECVVLGKMYCSRCSSGWTPSNNGTCIPICSSPYCTDCRAAGCFACQSGYRLSGGDCLPVCSSPSCINCVAPGTCESCTDPYRIPSSGCLLCQDGYALRSSTCTPTCSSPICSKCLSPELCSSCDIPFWNTSSGCLDCIAGFERVNNTCVGRASQEESHISGIVACYRQLSEEVCPADEGCRWCATLGRCLFQGVQACPACSALPESLCSGQCQWCALEETCKATGASCTQTCGAVAPRDCNAVPGCSLCVLTSACMAVGAYAQTCTADCPSQTADSCANESGLCQRCEGACMDYTSRCGRCEAVPRWMGRGACANETDEAGAACKWCESMGSCMRSTEQCSDCGDAQFASHCAVGSFRQCAWCQSTASCGAQTSGGCLCKDIRSGANCSGMAGCAWCESELSCVSRTSACIPCEDIALQAACAARPGCSWSEPLEFCFQGAVGSSVTCEHQRTRVDCDGFPGCQWCGSECSSGCSGSGPRPWWIIGAGGGAACLCGCVGAAIAVVARKRRQRSQGEADGSIDLASAYLEEGAQQVELDDEALGLAVDPKTLDVECLEIGEKRTASMRVRNTAGRACELRILVPQHVEKVEVAVTPETAALGPGMEVTVMLAVSARVRQVLPIGVSRDGTVYATVVLNIRSSTSTTIDYKEIRFDRVIGEGAFGVVRAGRWRGVPVAIKEIRKSMMDPTMEQDLKREVDLMERMRSPFLVCLYGTCSADNNFAIVMDLDGLIRKGPIEYGFKVKVAYDCAQGMSVLHGNGILHRDLKPANLLKSKCPECLGGKPYNIKADVYSYGMLLFELVTQSKPYNDFKNTFAVASFVLEGKRLELGDDNQLGQLAKQCWDQSPEKRPDFAQIVEHLMPQVNHAS
eukprot:m51a1_g6229 putative acyltransferase (1469) ;mRNA; f:253709-261190